MNKTPKELMKEYVDSQSFTSTTEVMGAMKEMFKDIFRGYLKLFEEKIIALYSCGMSQSDISEQIKNLYDVEISDGLVSKITQKIMPEVTA